MITMNQLNALYIDKLERTGSHDQAIRKVWWDAYQRGANDKRLNMNLEFKLLSPTAKLPTRAHDSDAGLDLYFDVGVEMLGTAMAYRTGVAVNIPHGYVGFIWPRSGLTVKTGYDTLAGVIDAGYTGEIKVIVDKILGVGQGAKIAQLIVQPVMLWNPVLVDNFDATDRGANGFGSSGE